MDIRSRRVASVCMLLALGGCSGSSPEDPVAPGREIPRPASLDQVNPHVVGFIENAIGVIEDDPGAAFPRAGLAMIYQAHEMFDVSRTAYEQALAIEPDNARWLYHLAFVRHELGDTRGAMEAIDRSIELSPTYAPSYRRRAAWQRELGNTLAADEDLERASRLGSEAADGDPWTTSDIARFRLDFPAYLGFVEALAATGEYDRALREFEALLQSRPDDARLLLQTGRTYLALQRHEEALTTLERGVEVHPEDPLLLAETAAALRALEQPERALEMLDRALEQSPADGLIHARRAAILHELGRFPEAAESYRQALTYRPQDTRVMLLYGDCLSRMQLLGEAAAVYRHALTLDESNAELHARFGVTLHRLGRQADAEAALARALEIEPGNAEWEEWLAEWRGSGAG